MVWVNDSVFRAQKSGIEQKSSLKKASLKVSSNDFSTKQNSAPYSAKNLQAYYLANPIKVSKVSFTSSANAQDVQLGCNFNSKTKALEFGVYSKNATRIELEIFDKPINGKTVAKIPMERKGDKWVMSVPKQALAQKGIHLDKKQPVYYGFRAWGPNWEYKPEWKSGSDAGFKSHVDDNGNRFNPNKLLTDPYAKEVSHDPISPEKQKTLDGTIYATGDEHYLKDSTSLAPKSVFVLEDKKSEVGKRPERALKDDIVYETHLRGLTQNDKSIPEELRGTYKGAAMKAKYLKELGVTMVEFLPVMETQNDQNDAVPNEQNYWGYMTLSFFAPDRRYAHDKSPGGPTKEFKEMVKAFHDEGIKVCMDVVYNHTGEGGTWGKSNTANLYSMRGLDSSTYYETCNNGKDFYDNAGCGGNYNIANPAAQKLAVDSLKYWSEEMGVDAFRHDLASILGNVQEKDGFYFDSNSDKSYLVAAPKEIKSRPVEGGKGVDFIAEPWAASGNFSYQLGHFPKTWSEWNDNFQHTVKSFLNRQENTSFSKLANAMCGSSDVFGGDRTRSVNFVTAHDGFTMKDLYSYNSKVNHGDYGSSDGGNDNNISWDQGGDSLKQRKAVRNTMAMLMLSKGTPMITGGDEILRTALGNNNAYNQDKPFNWINWKLDDTQKQMQEFTKGIMHFRQQHSALRDVKYFNGKDNNNNGLKDITWLKGDASEANGEYMDNPNNAFLAYRVDGTEFKDSAKSIYVAFNKGDNAMNYSLPKNQDGKQWYVAANTSEYLEKQNNIFPEGREEKVKSSELLIGPRSIMLLIEK